MAYFSTAYGLLNKIIFFSGECRGSSKNLQKHSIFGRYFENFHEMREIIAKKYTKCLLFKRKFVTLRPNRKLRFVIIIHCLLAIKLIYWIQN